MASAEKNSIVLYHNWFPILNSLEPEEAMKLLNALVDLDANGTIPDESTWNTTHGKICKGLFESWGDSVRINNAKWTETKERKRLGGLISRGILPKGSTLEDLIEYDMKKGSEESQRVSADSVTDIETGSGTETDTGTGTEKGEDMGMGRVTEKDIGRGIGEPTRESSGEPKSTLERLIQELNEEMQSK